MTSFFAGLGMIAATAFATVRPSRPKAGEPGKYFLPSVPAMNVQTIQDVDSHNSIDAELTVAEAELEAEWAEFCQRRTAEYTRVLKASIAEAATLLERRDSITEQRTTMGENLRELLRRSVAFYQQDILDAENNVATLRNEADTRLRKIGINEDVCPASANPYAAPDTIAFQWRQRLDREPEVERAIGALNRAKSALELLKSRLEIPITSYRETVRLAPAGDAHFMVAVLKP